jgi:hypothetical protein
MKYIGMCSVALDIHYQKALPLGKKRLNSIFPKRRAKKQGHFVPGLLPLSAGYVIILDALNEFFGAGLPIRTGGGNELLGIHWNEGAYDRIGCALLS